MQQIVSSYSNLLPLRGATPPALCFRHTRLPLLAKHFWSSFTSDLRSNAKAARCRRKRCRRDVKCASGRHELQQTGGCGGVSPPRIRGMPKKCDPIFPRPNDIPCFRKIYGSWGLLRSLGASWGPLGGLLEPLGVLLGGS